MHTKFWFVDEETGISIPPFCGGDGPQVGDPPAPAAPTADPNDGQDPLNAPPAEPTVPRAALIAERRRYQAQINSLTQSIQELTNTVGNSIKRPADDEGVSPEEAQKRKVKQHYGLDKIEAKLAEMDEKIAKLDQLEQQTQQLSNMFTSRENTRMDRAEKIGTAAYDKATGLSSDQWATLIASNLTPDDMDEIIVVGNIQHMNEVVKRVKGLFKTTGGVDTRTQQDLRTVNRLPRAAAPGGNPPGPPVEEKAIGRKLHERAGARFMESINRK